MNNMIRAIVVFLSTMALLFGSAVAVNATTTETVTQSIFTDAERAAVANKVYGASNPEVAAANLSVREKEIMQYNLDNTRSVVTAEEYGKFDLATGVKLTSNTALGAGTRVSSDGTTTIDAAAGCWYKYYYRQVWDLFIHTGNVWMQLNWCGDGKKITYSKLSNVGGQGLKGLAYTGHRGYILNTGPELRRAVQYTFKLGNATGNPCSQLRGTIRGTYTAYANCNLG